jgi:hypothetical protein
MMQPGLFAHFSSQHASSEEDWATEALTFILRGCPEAREALRDYVGQKFRVGLTDGIVYDKQVTDPDPVTKTGRPDVVGAHSAFGDQVVIEAKFWAGLTDKQPGAYLRRLSAGNPGLVLVVAPQVRLQLLWPELLANLAKYTSEPMPSTDHEPGRYELVRSSGHVLALTSWREVLDFLGSRLRATGAHDWLADLGQLRIQTERMDQEGFQPLLAQDLDMRTARQVKSLFGLITRLTDDFGDSDRLKKGNPYSSFGNPQFFGWWLQSKACGVWFWVGLYFDAWARLGGSPVWAAVYPDANWPKPELELSLSTLQLPAGARWYDDEYSKAVIAPLILRRSVVEDDVIPDLKSQLNTIAKTLDQAAAVAGLTAASPAPLIAGEDTATSGE